MVKEIYLRDESDPYYEEGVIDYSNEMESVISQVRMLLGTKQGDILGEYEFGIDIENLVFNTKRAGDLITEELNRAIGDYVKHSSKISVRADIQFGDSGYGYDYAIIDIYINGTKAVGVLVDKS